MGVGVQGEAGFSVAQNSGQSLGVHPAGQGMGCECVSEIMKAEAWQPRLLQQSFQVIVGGIGADGLFWPEERSTGSRRVSFAGSASLRCWAAG